MSEQTTNDSAAARRSALIIGITGGFGGAVARELLAHGWDVRALAG